MSQSGLETGNGSPHVSKCSKETSESKLVNFRLSTLHWAEVILVKKKGCTRLHGGVWGSVQPLWVLCTQPSPVFLEGAEGHIGIREKKLQAYCYCFG
jgi:hypothetical protein